MFLPGGTFGAVRRCEERGTRHPPPPAGVHVRPGSALPTGLNTAVGTGLRRLWSWLGQGKQGARQSLWPSPRWTLFTGCGVFLGNKLSLAEEEESEANVQKRKRKKKKKKNHLQPEHLGSGPEAIRPEQNGGGEPEASTGRVPKTPMEPGTVATPGPQEQSSMQPTPVHSRRKRPRKRSPTVQGGGVEPASPLPPEDAAPGGPSSARIQALAPGASPAGGAPIPKKKRKLGALPVNGSGPPVLAWPLAPGGRLKKKKGEPSSLDLHSPSGQKAAILKKRKRRKEGPESVSLGGVPEAKDTLVPALVRPPALICGAEVGGQARVPGRGAALVCNSPGQRGATPVPWRPRPSRLLPPWLQRGQPQARRGCPWPRTLLPCHIHERASPPGPILLFLRQLPAFL